MVSFKKILFILTLGFAVGTSTSFVHASCGNCKADKKHEHDHGHDHNHDHSKKACVKCDHEKSCSLEDCKDEAHKADCTCPKKEEKTEQF